MSIGEAAKASGVSAKMLRHHESIGLIVQAGRTAAGYRIYGNDEVDTLRFIRRARDFGIPIESGKAAGRASDTCFLSLLAYEARRQPPQCPVEP